MPEVPVRLNARGQDTDLSLREQTFSVLSRLDFLNPPKIGIIFNQLEMGHTGFCRRPDQIDQRAGLPRYSVAKLVELWWPPGF